MLFHDIPLHSMTVFLEYIRIQSILILHLGNAFCIHEMQFWILKYILHLAYAILNFRKSNSWSHSEIHSETHMKLIWNSYETHMELIWNSYGTHMKLIWNSFWIAYETHVKLILKSYEYETHMKWNSYKYETHIKMKLI